MIVTSDHGASPMPESVHGGRHHPRRGRGRRECRGERGARPGRSGSTTRTIRTCTSARRSSRSRRTSASRRSSASRIALRSFPSIEKVGAVADAAGHCETRHGDDRALCLTFDRERSGDLYYLPARGYIMDTEDEPAATAHGLDPRLRSSGPAAHPAAGPHEARAGERAGARDARHAHGRAAAREVARHEL